MAYTTPITWVGTTVVTVAQLNEQIRDNIDFVHTNLEYGAGILFTAATVSGTVNSFTISTAVPQTYQNLFLRGEGIQGYGAISDLYLRINNDSAANYKWAAVGRNIPGAGVIDESGNAEAGMKVTESFGTTAGYVADFDCRVHRYTSTTARRTLLGQAVATDGYVVSIFGIYQAMGTTIGTLSVYCPAGSISGGAFYLYGFNG